MAGVVVDVADAVAALLGKVNHLIDGVFDPAGRSCEVGVSAHDEDAKVGIACHCGLQAVRDVDDLVLGIPFPRADFACEDAVGVVDFVASEVVSEIG